MFVRYVRFLFLFGYSRKIACVAVHMQMCVVCLKFIQCRYSPEFEVVLTATNIRAVRNPKNIKSEKNTDIHDPLFVEPNVDCMHLAIGAW